jgi:hypothetical protein
MGAATGPESGVRMPRLITLLVTSTPGPPVMPLPPPVAQAERNTLRVAITVKKVKVRRRARRAK